MNRRHFLEWGGAALAVCIAGCSTLVSEGSDGVILTHVELGNASSERQVFDVLVSYDDEIIHWDSYEVAARKSDSELGGKVVEVDSPDDPGRVEVHVRVDEKWERTDFDTVEFDGERVIAIATFGRPEDGVLRLSRIVSDRGTSANN